jgi:hypothetical protein
MKITSTAAQAVLPTSTPLTSSPAKRLLELAALPPEALKSELDALRLQLGQSAVDKLVAELPAQALLGLRAISGDLPVRPGESAYLAYKRKWSELVAKEGLAHKVASAIIEVREKLHYNDGCAEFSSLQSAPSIEAHLERINEGRGDGGFFSLKPERIPRKAVEAAAARWNRTVDQLNQKILSVWPEAVPERLLAGAFGHGPGKQSVDGYARASYHADPELLPSLRSEIAGYAELQKEVLVLEQHLRSKAMMSDPEVVALRAALTGPEASSIPMSALYDKVKSTIDEIAGLRTDSEIKRETLENRASGSSSASSAERTVSTGILGLQKTSRTVSGSSGHFESSGQSEVLNLEATHYTIVETPAFDQLDASRLAPNHASRFEVSLLLDRLLTARRIYEGMCSRDRDDPHVAALKHWMEESAFTISAADPTASATFTMGDLRQDILRLAKQGRYPRERVGMIGEEIALGPARRTNPLDTLVKPLSFV